MGPTNESNSSWIRLLGKKLLTFIYNCIITYININNFFIFLYIQPFEHSESLNDQLTSVELYKQLHASVIESPELNPLYGQFTQQFLNYAILHHDIIAKFGRYPHRNFILGRTSSAEEIEYLESGAQTFGVTKIK